MAPHPPARAHPVRTPHRLTGGGGRIRTFEGVSRQIYSLLPLAAWVPLRENEPRILISGDRGVNASWRAICWVSILFSLGRARLPAQAPQSRAIWSVGSTGSPVDFRARPGPAVAARAPPRA